MVISLLPYLVAAHELSILELSKRCGVSRPALTALANNTGKGVQFETHDIPAECAVTFDGECGVDAEIRPALNGTTCDDDSFIEAISSCKPACELVRSLLAQSLEREYAGYDVSASAWV